MKHISIYISPKNFKDIKEILHKKSILTSFVKVQGEGAFPIEPALKMVRSYNYGEKFTPEYVETVEVQSIVKETDMQDIVNEIKNLQIKGKVVVYDVLEFIDL
jgi:nitrogen regulatory protein PII